MQLRALRHLVPTLGLLLGTMTTVIPGEAPQPDTTPKPAQVRPNEIREVKIVGTRNTHPDRIKFVLTTRPGQVLDQLALADDVRTIEKMGPYINTRSELQRNADGTITVIFTVVEQPYVSDVSYPDLNYFQRTGIEKYIETKKGGWLNPLILETDRRAIEIYFQDKGYRYARVTVEKENDRGNISIKFRVDLGKEIKVARAIYKNLPPKIFQRQLDPVLLNQPGNAYHAELLPFDQGAVVRAIQDQGWLDAKLNSTTAEHTDYIRPLDERRRNGPAFAPDGITNDSVMLVFDLDPGERYYLGSVSFVDNTVASSAELREAFGLAEGSPYKRIDIDRAIERARRVISNQGYARCDIRADRGLDLENHRVNLVLHVSEGRKYKLGRIDINGNYITKDAVIRRALDLMPGELWNDDQIDESKRQIERTGLFRRTIDRQLRIYPRFPEDRPDEADLRVDLEEDNTGSLNFQVGFSSADGVFVQAGFSEANFNALGFLGGLVDGNVARDWRGAGQRLSLGLQWSELTTSANLNWTNPHLMDGPYSMSLGYSYINSYRRSWEEVRSIPTVTFGRNFLNNDLRLSLGYAYTALKVREPDPDAPNDALIGEGKYHINTLSLTQSYDRLNNPRIPTRGYLLTASESYSSEPLANSNEWWSYTLRGDTFIPLIEGEQGGITYFHVNARFSQIIPLGDSEVVPFYQRYYGGGPQPRHRGFDSDELSPIEINTLGNRTFVGGTTDALVSAEISMPIQDSNEGIRLAVFTDYGNVWGADESMSLDDMRTAIGFGVRFPIMIPVALDFAWLLDAKQGESTTQIQFTLGQFRY